MGYDSVWTAEAYGNDAVTAAAWVLAQTTKIKVGTAIMQMPAQPRHVRDDVDVPGPVVRRAFYRRPGRLGPRW